MGNFLHRLFWGGRYLSCFCAIFALSTFVFLFLPHFDFFNHVENKSLIFEKPDFQSPPPEDPEEEPQANQGYRIEHTPRGLLRFKTEIAGSPAFGTPVPEILSYDLHSKLAR